MSLLKAGRPGAPTIEKRVEKLRLDVKEVKEITKISMNIPTKIHDAFKTKCFRNRIAMRDVLINYMLKYLEREEEA